MRRFSWLAILMSAATAAPRPAFEVASIKMYPSGAVVPPGTGGFKISPAGSIASSYTTLRMYLQWAYSVDGEISGPRWIDEERYDIAAKAAGPASLAQLKLMFQTLLEDRFQLKVRMETKDLPVTVLVVGDSGVRNLQAGSAGRFEVRRDRGILVVNNAPMPAIANILGSPLGNMPLEKVFDQTGLRGVYGIKLDLRDFNPKDPAFAGSDSEMRAALTLFVSDALERQYGLKLERRKMPLTSLVVDAGNQVPTAN